MTYTFYRYVAGKRVSIVSARGNDVPEAVSKLSAVFNGVFLLIRKGE